MDASIIDLKKPDLQDFHIAIYALLMRGVKLMIIRYMDYNYVMCTGFGDYKS